MQKLIKIGLVALIAVSFMVSSCSTSKKGSCGCPNKRGLVGY